MTDACSEAAATEDAPVSDARVGPTADASEAAAMPGDAGNPTVPVMVGTGAPASISGAASSDGSAMLILGGGALTTERPS